MAPKIEDEDVVIVSPQREPRSGDICVVRVNGEDTLKKRPDLAQRFVRALRRGYQEAAADPQAGVDVLLRGTKEEVDEAIERPGADLLAPLWQTDATPFGDQDAARWSSFTEWMQANGLVSGGVSADDAFTNRFSGEQ